MPYYPHDDASKRVEWADQFPHDVDSIVTETRVLLYCDPSTYIRQQLTDDSVDGGMMDLVDSLLETKDAISAKIGDYGYADFFTDFETVHRTPLHMIYTFSDDKINDLFGDLNDEHGLSYSEFDTMFEHVAVKLAEEFRQTPFAFEDDVMDEIMSEDKNTLILYCNRATEIIELGLLSPKQARCYLLQHNGLKNKHIADLLDIEVGTVGTHIARAKEKIKHRRRGVEVIDEATEHNSAVISVMQDRIGDFCYDSDEDKYYQIKYAGDFDGGMIGFVLQDSSGEDVFIMNNRLSAYEYISESDVPDDVTFPEPTVNP